MGMAVGGGSGPQAEHQHDAADRRAAGAADHLHGDHAADAEGPGSAGAAAVHAESPPPPDNDRTVVIIIDKDRKMMLNTDRPTRSVLVSD